MARPVRDPALRTYRLAVYGVFWAILLALCVLTTAGVVRALWFEPGEASLPPSPPEAGPPEAGPR
jgi:hypothetical protein